MKKIDFLRKEEAEKYKIGDILKIKRRQIL
jgi:hypothetical protein